MIRNVGRAQKYLRRILMMRHVSFSLAQKIPVNNVRPAELSFGRWLIAIFCDYNDILSICKASSNQKDTASPGKGKLMIVLASNRRRMSLQGSAVYTGLAGGSQTAI